MERLSESEDYTVDEKFRSVSITEAGIAKVEQFVGIPNIYSPENLRLVHYLEEALKAKALFKIHQLASSLAVRSPPPIFSMTLL